MNVYSLSFFRHGSSGYEQPSCGVSRGIFFLNFIPAIVRAFHAVYPESSWQMRFHVDDAVMAGTTGKLLERYQAAGLISLVRMGEAKTLCGSMLWRLWPLFDPLAEYVICRDVDSLPMPRERKMFQEFADFGGGIHAVHDSESHTGPLMGGMIAIKASEFRKSFENIRTLDALIAMGDFLKLDYDRHGTDQQFLNAVVWPRMKDGLMIHTRLPYAMYDCKTLPVAAQREPLDRVIAHIGAAFPVDDAIKEAEAMGFPMLEKIKECEA